MRPMLFALALSLVALPSWAAGLLPDPALSPAEVIAI